MILLLKYWKPLAVVLAALLVFGYGYKLGNDHLQAEWDKALLRQHENNLKVNTEVSDAYQKKLADLRKRYDALRMRPPGSVPIPNTPGRADAAPGTNGFHGCMAEVDGYSLMFQGDIQTQQLIALQNWVQTISK